MPPQMQWHTSAWQGPAWFRVTWELWWPLLLQGSAVGRPQGVMAEKLTVSQLDTEGGRHKGRKDSLGQNFRIEKPS